MEDYYSRQNRKHWEVVRLYIIAMLIFAACAAMYWLAERDREKEDYFAPGKEMPHGTDQKVCLQADRP